VEEKDVHDVPFVVQALPHAAVPGGGEGYPLCSLVLCRPTTRCCSWWRKDIHDVPFVEQALMYHTLLFLVEEKDIQDVPCVVQALPHAAVPGGGKGYP
jgi:hypothetical protein